MARDVKAYAKRSAALATSTDARRVRRGLRRMARSTDRAIVSAGRTELLVATRAELIHESRYPSTTVRQNRRYAEQRAARAGA